MATLLSTVQQFCGRQGLPIPTTVFGTTDSGVLQFMRLLEEECIELASRGNWQTLINEITFLSVATESQGTISAGLGSGPTALNGYRYMFPQIIWDRTERLPILGAVNPQDWQALKAVQVTGPRWRFRWRQDQLLINPVPTAGHTYAFEYVTDNWVNVAGGATGAALFAGDTDTIRLPGSIVLMGLRWRWKKDKGFSYAEDFATYERMVADGLGRDKAADILKTDGQADEVTPGIWVPSGNWPVS